MYYLIEQNPRKEENVIFKSYDLMEVEDKKMEMECQEFNEFCVYSILELVSVEKRIAAMEERKDELTREMLSPYVDKAIKRKLEEEQDEL